MNRTSALRSRAPNIDVRLASCIVGVTVSLPFNGSLDPVIFTVKIPNFVSTYLITLSHLGKASGQVDEARR